MVVVNIQARCLKAVSTNGNFALINGLPTSIFTTSNYLALSAYNRTNPGANTKAALIGSAINITDAAANDIISISGIYIKS